MTSYSKVTNPAINKQQILQVLATYRQAVERRLLLGLEGTDTALKNACEYALLSGGKRFRASIVLMIGKALNCPHDLLYPALSIEYFHTASLIADDLPCMDDEAVRRDKPTVHKVYGEATALLATYSLISAGYGCLYTHCQQNKTSSQSLGIALQSATRCTGLLGAAGGQYLDLFSTDRSFEGLEEIIVKKTVSLFEIAFIYGWVFGLGDLARLDEVRAAAYHWGMAFQIADDLGDMGQDLDKSTNAALILGQERAFMLFHYHIESLKRSLGELGLCNSDFSQIIQALCGFLD